MAEHQFKELIENYFPFMWVAGRVVLEGLPPNMEYAIPGRRYRK